MRTYDGREVLKCVFVDINKQIETDCLGRDGLHLNRKGAFKLESALKNVINLCLGQGN